MLPGTSCLLLLAGSSALASGSERGGAPGGWGEGGSQGPNPTATQAGRISDSSALPDSGPPGGFLPVWGPFGLRHSSRHTLLIPAGGRPGPTCPPPPAQHHQGWKGAVPPQAPAAPGLCPFTPTLEFLLQEAFQVPLVTCHVRAQAPVSSISTAGPTSTRAAGSSGGEQHTEQAPANAFLRPTAQQPSLHDKPQGPLPPPLLIFSP